VIKLRTISVDDTRELAAALGELARPGDLLLLVGELGVGKTAFAQGFGAALGVTEPITSPTFTLAAQYQGRLELNHLDVYRLDQLDEVFDLGLPELLDEGGVTLVEWGDAIVPVLPADYLEVRLAFGDDDDERQVEVVAVGHRWSARVRALTTALQRWIEGEVPC
jgi:tRNA threonylcarbamoyladenosine biosynthesis protein TsaE